MSSIQYTRVSNSTPVVKENETKPTLISRPKRVIEKTLIPVEVTSTLYDIIKNKNNDVKRYITMDVKKIFSENSNLDPSVIYDSLIDVETIVDTFITFQTSEIQKEKIEKEKIKVELRSKGYVPYTPIGFYPDIPKRRVDAISVDLEKLRTSDLRAKAESMRNHIQKLKNKKPIFLLSFDEMEKLYPGSVSKNTFDRANLFRDEYVRWSIEVLENELKAFTEKNRDQLQSHLLDSLKSSSKRAIDHDEQIGRKDRRTLVFPDIYGKTLCRTKEERQAIKETESYFRTSDRKVDREPLSGKLENPSGVTINDVINNELYDFVSEILIRERDVAIELYKSKLSQEEKNIYESELHMKSSVHNKIYGLLWKLTKNELKKRENIQIDPNWNEEYERQNMIHSEMMRAKMKHDVLRIVSGGISIGLNMYFYSKIGFPFDSFLSVMSDNTTVYSLPLYCAAWVLVPLLRAEISQTMTIWTQHLAKKGYGLIVPDRFRIELDGDSDVNSDPTKRRTGRLIYTSSKDVGQLDQLFVRMKVKNEYVGTKNMWGISSTFKGTYPYRIVTAMRDIVMYPVSCNPVLFVCSSITSIAAYCMSTAVMSFLLREDNRKLVYDVFRGVAGFVWTKETSRLTDMFTDMRTNPAVWRLLASWMITSIGARKWTEGLGKSVTEKMENLTWFKDPLFSEEVAVKIESAMAKKPDWINYSLAQMTGGIATILSNALLNEVGGMSMGALCNDGVNLISSLGDSQAMELWTVSVSGNINKAMMNFMENYVNNEKMKSYETGEQVEKGMLNFGKEISQMMKNQVYKGMNDLRDIVHMTAEVTCTAVETISYDLFGIKTEADLEDINEWRRTMYDVTKTPAERASALKNWQRKYNPDDERAYSERIDDIKAETKFRDDLQTIADKTKELLSSSNPKLEEIKPLFESFKKTGNELEELLNSKGPQNPLVKIDPNSVRGMWGQIQDPSIKTGTGVDIEPNATKIAVAIADAERWIKVGEGFKGKHVYPLVGDITKSIIRNAPKLANIPGTTKLIDETATKIAAEGVNLAASVRVSSLIMEPGDKEETVKTAADWSAAAGVAVTTGLNAAKLAPNIGKLVGKANAYWTVIDTIGNSVDTTKNFLYINAVVDHLRLAFEVGTAPTEEELKKMKFELDETYRQELRNQVSKPTEASTRQDISYINQRNALIESKEQEYNHKKYLFEETNSVKSRLGFYGGPGWYDVKNGVWEKVGWKMSEETVDVHRAVQRPVANMVMDIMMGKSTDKSRFANLLSEMAPDFVLGNEVWEGGEKYLPIDTDNRGVANGFAATMSSKAAGYVGDTINSRVINSIAPDTKVSYKTKIKGRV